jgi:hypothetical protein
MPRRVRACCANVTGAGSEAQIALLREDHWPLRLSLRDLLCNMDAVVSASLRAARRYAFVRVKHRQ